MPSNTRKNSLSSFSPTPSCKDARVIAYRRKDRSKTAFSAASDATSFATGNPWTRRENSERSPQRYSATDRNFAQMVRDSCTLCLINAADKARWKSPAVLRASM